LKEQGLNPYQASQVMGVHRSTATRAAKSGGNVLASLVPSAKKALKKTVLGEQVGNADKPHASDVIKAAETIIDRTFGKAITKQEVSADITVQGEQRTVIDAFFSFTSGKDSVINGISQPLIMGESDQVAEDEQNIVQAIDNKEEQDLT